MAAGLYGNSERIRAERMIENIATLNAGIHGAGVDLEASLLRASGMPEDDVWRTILPKVNAAIRGGG